jgi:hypothetical protein
MEKSHADSYNIYEMIFSFPSEVIMSNDEYKKELKRTTSFAELAGDIINYQPRTSRKREKVDYADPYFRVLDAGHDLLMAKKRGKEIYENLPKELQRIVGELESIVKDMTLSAMSDDFDYSVELNRSYFNMMRIDRLSNLLAFKMKRFTRNKDDVEKYLGDIGKGSLKDFNKQLSRMTGIAEELSTSSNMFMDHIEKEFVLENDMLIKRDLAHEKTMDMINHM